MITGGDFRVQGESGHDLHSIIRKEFAAYVAPNSTHDSNDCLNPPRCHPGTRVAVLRDLENWVRTAMGTEDVLWLFGAAGAGKTAIARSLAEILVKVDLMAGSFFFFRPAAGRNSEKLFVSTLAYQLAFAIPKMKPYIASSIREDPLIFQRSIKTQFTRFIVDPIIKISSPSGIDSETPSPKLIIIDGLDECLNREGQCIIVKTICAAAPFVRHRLKFLIASRPEFHIESTFDLPSCLACTRRVDLQSDIDAYDDIRFFITSKFTEIKQVHPLRLTLDNSWPTDDVIDRLVQNSSISNFVYARTVMDFIMTTYDRPQDRLEVILGLTHASDTDSPFAELDELYRYILSSVRGNIEDVMQILTIAVLGTAREGIQHGHYSTSELLLSPEFLEKILDLKSGTVELLLIDLRSLMTIQKNGVFFPTIKLTHKSLSDFLLDSSRSGPYCVGEKKAYLDVAFGCLRVLEQKTFGRAWWINTERKSTSSRSNALQKSWDRETEYFSALLWACERAPRSAELQHAIATYDLCGMIQRGLVHVKNDVWALFDAWSIISHLFKCLKDSEAFTNSGAYEHQTESFNALVKSHLKKYPSDDPLVDAFFSRKGSTKFGAKFFFMASEVVRIRAASVDPDGASASVVR
ncbi:unnamed protein product [Cyclocybe aegerita]|uniref:Nephrocystin 3-like N-terminal domain-containing protein n=1 Tax=Cyclocybe aegerita TaxID=1973307 RepID=A0A8S0WDX9_CYCAE|nr:unnamed protein product [Cyclocybe aegerita]